MDQHEVQAGGCDPSAIADGGTPRLHTVALEALAQIQTVLQANTNLVQQAAAREEQA